MNIWRFVVVLVVCNVGFWFYGKFLQCFDIDFGVIIFDQVLDVLVFVLEIDEVVLGVFEGFENVIFIEIVYQKGLCLIFGD